MPYATSREGTTDPSGDAASALSMARWAKSVQGPMRAATSGPRPGVAEAPAIISTRTVT